MNLEIINNNVAKELNLKLFQIEAVIELSDEGCTIPFISRYRKERTGNLDEVAVNSVLERYSCLVELEKRRDYIIKYLTDNEKLTPELDKRLRKASSMSELEDIYLPFKPRKKTLADKAIELGLEPLSKILKEKNLSEEEALKAAEEYVGDDVPDSKTALEHAKNILVQEVSDSAEVRGFVRDNLRKGKLECSAKRGKKDEGVKYRDYFDYSEDATKVASHRVMALLRGVREGMLNLGVEPRKGEDDLSHDVALLHFKKRGLLLTEVSEESFGRHLKKSIGNEIFKELGERAERDSLDVFSKNLENILLFSPFGEKSVIGIDPGIRTGCKAALLDENGDFSESATLYLNRNVSEAKKLLEWVNQYDVKGIAIGSGTFGRETYKILKELFLDSPVVIALVNEDGASIYSASETARDEFPDLDLTVRGAISIGRRFQDPMAELVKIDPKSLGVGQYQHDISPSLLKEGLTKTVEWAVNRVGVNLNTAGYHLLSCISGLDMGKARELVKYRSEHKRISSIKELKKVKGIGAKAFEQSAGFLRIKDGKNILDSTGVHPESYGHVEDIAKLYGVSLEELVENPDMIKLSRVKKELDIPELESIINELKSRGLDPRSDFSTADFRDDIESIDDLKEGDILNGVIDNVAAFGAFVDLGIKDKGLVHISEVSDEYIEDINSVLSVGDRVSVKVTAIDLERRRISLSIKEAK